MAQCVAASGPSGECLADEAADLGAKRAWPEPSAVRTEEKSRRLLLNQQAWARLAQISPHPRQGAGTDGHDATPRSLPAFDADGLPGKVEVGKVKVAEFFTPNARRI